MKKRKSPAEQITAARAVSTRKARSSPMEAKPSKARQPMWMISMMR